MPDQNVQSNRICFVHESIREYRKRDIRDSVCGTLPVDFQHSGHDYCILHLPDDDKSKPVFAAEIDKKIKEADYDFRAVYFPVYAEFSDLTFEKPVDFRSATFTKNVSFIGAEFVKDANFSWATFQADTFFDLATFKEKALFDSAVFGKDSDVNFNGVTFVGTADFSYATFGGFISFGRKNKDYSRKEDIEKNPEKAEKAKNETYFTDFGSHFKLEHVRLESPNKVKFYSIRLRPYWFVNTEAAKFNFTNCRWKMPDESYIKLDPELEDLRQSVKELSTQRKSEETQLTTEDLLKLLTKTFWQLADNHEENKSFRKASRFRRLAQESNRKEEYGGWKFWSWQWWYWLTSVYGESPFHAGLVLAGLLLLFTLAFMLNDFHVCPLVKSIPEKACDPRALFFGESVLYSLATATFQNIEYIKPATKLTTFFIILEKILVPLQAALLALAIRRKFMR